MANTPRAFILITGISSGIGLYLAKNLSKTYSIIGTVRKEIQKLELEAEVPNLKVYVMEMRDPNSIRSAFEQIKLDHPELKIKALINNAGYAVPGPLVELNTKLLEEQLRVNLIAPIELIQLSLPFLMNGESRIINMSSVSGLFASPFLGAYCASKYGLEAISDSLRRELALIGIKVILIEPGSIKTHIWAKHLGLKLKFPHSKFSYFLNSSHEESAPW